MAAPRSNRSASTPQRAPKIAIPQLDWAAARPAPIVLVSGTEAVLAERALRSVRDQLKAEDPSLEVSELAADSYAPGELLSLASPSLFGEPRLIRVTAVEKCNDAFLNEAIAYLAQPADDTVVLLRHAGGVRGKRLLEAIRSATGVAVEIVCGELKRDSDKFDFARAEFRRANREITPGALRALTSAFADDLAELAAACQQLLDDTPAGRDQPITEATVDRYYGGRVEASAFKVADAALAGRAGDALIALRHALASGEDPVPMVAALASKVRTMAKLHGHRGSSNELARQFGLAPWQVDRARDELRGWTQGGLASAVLALAQADHEVKGAGRDPVYTLERLVGLLAARGRPAS